MPTGSTIHLFWDDRGVHRRFRTGVSLHSHTLHSRESFGFLLRLRRRFAPLDWLLRREEGRCEPGRSGPSDYSRAWWTPPLAAHAAWLHERAQIENALGLRPLVSITDHDNIEASALLHVLEDGASAPISLEWTLPADGSCLHLGVHNLPSHRAAELMGRIKAHRDGKDGESPEDILAALNESPSTLVVLNHPHWDEKGLGLDQHRSMIGTFLARHRAYIHALELNGWRPWSQNLAVMEMSRATGLPMVSGGDRHAIEPASLLNLTGAAGFDEFVEEVRFGRHSHVLFMPEYREPRRLRTINALAQVLDRYPDHGMGWTEWNDRIFFRTIDGRTVSLREYFGLRPPASLRLFIRLALLFGGQRFRPALRLALARREEVLP